MRAVSFIVFTYNNEDIIGRCLDSIRKQAFKNFDCLVVDDNSTDGTLEVVKRYRWVKIHKKSVNTGPSESRNIGIQKTKGKYIAMLDSDVILDKNWLKSQIKLLEADNSVGVLGSKLLYLQDKKKINSAGGCLTRLGFGFDRGSGKRVGAYSNCEDLMYVCSAACIIRRSIIKDVGLFDETFFYPHEDTDFCWRVNISGYRVVYNPGAVALHAVGMTTGKMNERVVYNVTKNRIRSLLKNYEVDNIIKYVPSHLLLIFLDVIIRGNKISKLKGILWNLLNLDNTIKERQWVQAKRIVKDNELKRLFAKQWINENG